MAFYIWRITDGKAGHDSQSIGLCKAINRLKASECIDLPIQPSLTYFKNFFLKQFPLGNNLPDPNIIIGAGHSTHLPMLCAKRARGGKTIVLMKPSLPLSFFNTCIIPEHDQTTEKENVITTSGAINPVQFNENKSANTGLILIGGPSKHYRWNNKSILKQITQIINDCPDIKWTVADSPRTPDTALSGVSNLANITILNYKNTSSRTIREIIFKTGNIWVSKDSVSMIYESLSSGAAVGILDVEQNNNNKISDAINRLINEKQLSSFEMWKNTKYLIPASTKFNEADRCASLLQARGILA
ncbi:MAG: nucleoside-diphosphate sugar epimerase [Proteobacteria bacterium]|nr:nucleoside-diphosphate sugar epimerase [Pseudomonadota bacterium]NOG60713.1 nucleoside-diphosphate sugar epimerase [Pseudomonadota bacterium]